MLVSLHYRPRGSIIETFDPRARWIVSILFLFSITFFWDYRVLLFFLFLAVLQYALTHLTWKETRYAWLLTTTIVATTVIINTLITSSGTISSVMRGGHPIWGFVIHFPIFGWTVNFVLTIERVWFAFCQALRIFSIAMIFLVIPFTMDPRIYGVTFKGLGFPDRLAFTMDLAFRFIPTLSRDFATTLDAQRARGYEIERTKGGLAAQIRKVTPLIVPVTMNSILTGEDVVNAMDLRCFGLRPRTWIEKLSYHWPDYALIGFGILIFVGSIILRYVVGIGDFVVPAWMLPA